MGSAGAVHPGKRTRGSKVSVLGGGGREKTRADSSEGDREQGEERDGGKEESWGLTWSNNHSKMELFPLITQAIHVLIRRFS